MSDIELKKCPFCGGEAELLEGRFTDNTEYFQIVCQKCYSSTALYTKKNNAIECWNSRPFENPALEYQATDAEFEETEQDEEEDD